MFDELGGHEGSVLATAVVGHGPLAQDTHHRRILPNNNKDKYLPIELLFSTYSISF